MERHVSLHTELNDLLGKFQANLDDEAHRMTIVGISNDRAAYYWRIRSQVWRHVVQQLTALSERYAAVDPAWPLSPPDPDGRWFDWYISDYTELSVDPTDVGPPPVIPHSPRIYGGSSR